MQAGLESIRSGNSMEADNQNCYCPNVLRRRKDDAPGRHSTEMSRTSVQFVMA